MEELVNLLKNDLKTNTILLTSSVSIISLIAGGFFTIVLWPLVKNALIFLFENIINKFTRRNYEIEYLEWMIQEHSNLPILPTTLVPVTDATPQEIDELYISLNVKNFDGNKDDKKREDEKSKNIESIEDVLRKYKRAIILGDPSAGKTTILRYLALNFARARLKRKYFTINKSNSEHIKLIDSYSKIREEYNIRTTPLPIFLHLNRIRAYINLNTALLDIINDPRGKPSPVGRLSSSSKAGYFS